MFLNPRDILKHLPFRRNARVGDFGSGAGTYSLAVLDRVGQEGSVYAFDIVPGNVEKVCRECARSGAENLLALKADLNTRIPLRDALLDAALVINTLHALTERERFLTELNRVLVPGGTVLFVDWASSFKNMGPRDEDVVAPGDAERLFGAHGFRSGDMLPAGTHHYAFLAEKL